MPIATKNGSLIVKDGKLAESCGCCGGWYCYQDCAASVCPPCGYTNPMPTNLNVTLSFNVPSTIYAAAFGGNAFGGGFRYWPVKIQPSDFPSANRTFAIANTNTMNSCKYSGTSGSGLFPYVASATINGTGAVFSSRNWSGSSCDTCSRRLVFGDIQIPVSGKQPDPNLSTFANTSTGWANAATNSYIASQIYQAVPALSDDSPPTYFTNISNIKYPAIQMLIGAASSSVDVPACSTLPFDVIDYTFVFDVIYTECSGASPAIQRLARALSVRVFQ